MAGEPGGEPGGLPGVFTICIRLRHAIPAIKWSMVAGDGQDQGEEMELAVVKIEIRSVSRPAAFVMPGAVQGIHNPMMSSGTHLLATPGYFARTWLECEFWVLIEGMGAPG